MKILNLWQTKVCEEEQEENEYANDDDDDCDKDVDYFTFTFETNSSKTRDKVLMKVEEIIFETRMKLQIQYRQKHVLRFTFDIS